MARLAPVARSRRSRGRQPRRDVLEGEAIIAVSVEQGVQPLNNGKLLLFQMTRHLRNELLADFPELSPAAPAWPTPENFGRDHPKTLGDRLDRGVLSGKETSQIAFTSGADEREHDGLLKDMVSQNLIERTDQRMQLLSLLVVTCIRTPLASFARYEVLQVAHPYQNAEVLLVQNFSQ